MVGNELVSVANLLPQLLDELQQKAEHGPAHRGPTTGLRDLDHILGGLRSGELIVIGGRPAMGKTSMAINICTHVAVVQQLTVLVFSELPLARWLVRMVATRGGIVLFRLDSGLLAGTEWPKLTATIEELRGAKVLLCDIGKLASSNFAAECQLVERERGPLGLVLIDSLQIDSEQHPAVDGMTVTQRLKQLAVDLKAPVVATAHLQSSLESRPIKQPQLSDFIAAEAIERHADVVMTLYREQYYLDGSVDMAGTAEVFVARNRAGATAKIPLVYRQGVARFEDLPLLPSTSIAGSTAHPSI
jgi:replicative DNA helicase